ncbi:MAG: ABC transporter ATP-binding protein [Planctomycetota bacterium]
MALVEIDNLSKRFGDFYAVRDVTFSFDRGSIYGFIGPNGAGKTTTMRILATLETASSGDLRLDGVSVLDYPDRVRERIGFLPDYYGTYANTSVRDYLDFFGRAYGLRGAELARRIDGVMEFTGLDALAEKATAALSKGMKQRLALGRVLLNDPDLLILDEPAAGLDPRARVEFRELVKVLAERGKAILISSHILTELSELVHGCAIIERGRIVRQGTVAELRAAARESRAEHETTAVRIELWRDEPATERVLTEQANVSRVVGGGRHYGLAFAGDAEGLARLLRSLVAAELPLIGFSSDEGNLEDVFMAVTRGEVQ